MSNPVVHGFEWTQPHERQHLASFINPTTSGSQRLVVTTASSRDQAQACGEWISAGQDTLMPVHQ